MANDPKRYSPEDVKVSIFRPDGTKVEGTTSAGPCDMDIRVRGQRLINAGFDLEEGDLTNFWRQGDPKA